MSVDVGLARPVACDPAAQCCLLGEREIRRVRGAVGHVSDGELVATSHRLLFAPWNLGMADWLVQYGCKTFGDPPAESGIYVVGKRADRADCADLGVGAIVGARPISAASWTSAPTLGVEKSDGTEAVFGVAPVAGSPSDRSARDDLLSVISRTFLGRC